MSSRQTTPDAQSTSAARLSRALGGFVVALLAAMVVNVLWQIISRYLLGRPSAVTEEIARFLLIWLGLFGGAYAASFNDHIALDLLPIGTRWRRTFRRSAMCLLGLVLLVGGTLLVHLVYVLEQRSAALGIPLAWVYAAAPLSGLLLILFASHPEEPR